MYKRQLNNQLFTLFFFIDGLSDTADSSDSRRDIYHTGLRTMCDRLYGTIDRLAELSVWSEADAAAVTDVSELLDTMVRALQVYASYKHIELRMQGHEQPLLVRGDRTALTALFSELFSNAVKYSPCGTAEQPVSLELRIQASEEEVTVEIENAGPGLSAKDMEKLYTPGWTGSFPPSGGEPQLGHGLALAQELVQLLNGRLECRSEPGQFTRFLAGLRRSL